MSDNEVRQVNGLKKLILTKSRQDLIGCSVGDKVTLQQPYTYVQKDLIISSLKLDHKPSEFPEIEDDIYKSSMTDILVCYIKNAKEFNEFYVCLTKEAEQFLSNKIMNENKEDLRSIIKMKEETTTTTPSEQKMIKNSNLGSELIQSIRGLKDQQMSNKRTKEPKQNTVENSSENCVESLSQKYQLIPSTKNGISNFVLKMGEIALDRDSLITNVEVGDKISHDNCDQYAEYQSFIDIKICKGKKVVSLTWHPSIDGVLAASYMNEPFNGVEPIKTNHNYDPIHQVLHDVKPVLIWSFKDFLKPKLSLESYREVASLSFCPYNENILIGGCVNGQVNIWDLRDKLKNFNESLNDFIQKQLKFQNTYNQSGSFSDYVKYVNDDFLVPLTAFSQTEKSHTSLIHTIQWIPERYTVTKYGKVIENETNVFTYQFLTGSDDGVILIWELKAPTAVKRNATIVFEKSERYLHLKKKLLDPLTVCSPYENLHRIFQPFYTIYVKFTATVDKEIMHPITAVLPITKNKLICGTAEGRVLLIEFQGHEKTVSKMFSMQENATILMDEFKHDAPVISVIKCSYLDDVYLTIGGHIIALWKLNSKISFITYTNNSGIYTSGTWSLFRATLFYLCTSDGILEVWDLRVQSEKPLEVYHISGKILTLITVSGNFIAISDFDGSIRLFHIPGRHMRMENSDISWFYNYIKHEIYRKNMILNWKSNNRQIEENIESTKEQTTNIDDVKEIGTDTTKRKSSIVKERKTRDRLEEALQQVLYARKNLRKVDLELKQIPLKNQEFKEKQKKLKIEKKLTEKEEFYHDLKALLFPEVFSHEKSILFFLLIVAYLRHVKYMIL